MNTTTLKCTETEMTLEEYEIWLANLKAAERRARARRR